VETGCKSPERRFHSSSVISLSIDLLCIIHPYSILLNTFSPINNLSLYRSISARNSPVRNGRLTCPWSRKLQDSSYDVVRDNSFQQHSLFYGQECTLTPSRALFVPVHCLLHATALFWVVALNHHNLSPSQVEFRRSAYAANVLLCSVQCLNPYRLLVSQL
jgi:hypothetical protein